MYVYRKSNICHRIDEEDGGSYSTYDAIAITLIFKFCGVNYKKYSYDVYDVRVFIEFLIFTLDFAIIKDEWSYEDVQSSVNVEKIK